MCHFTTDYFKDLPFIFGFWQSYYDVSTWGFIYVYPPWFFWTPWNCGVLSLIRFGKFSAISSLNILFFSIFLFFPGNPDFFFFFFFFYFTPHLLKLFFIFSLCASVWVSIDLPSSSLKVLPFISAMSCFLINPSN